jgi:hypothetical protein
MKKIRKKPSTARKTLVISGRRKKTSTTTPEAGVNANFIGRLKGVFRIVGDIESPVVPPEAWEYD